MSAEPLPPADRLVRVGAALFLLGVLATVATVAPLLLGDRRLPLAFYLLSVLTPIGLGLALAGMVAGNRARRR